MALEKLLSSRQVCDLLGIHLKTLQRYCREGKINFVSLNGPLGKHRFRESAVALFIAQRVVSTAGRKPRKRARPAAAKSAEKTAAQPASITRGEAPEPREPANWSPRERDPNTGRFTGVAQQGGAA